MEVGEGGLEERCPGGERGRIIRKSRVSISSLLNFAIESLSHTPFTEFHAHNLQVNSNGLAVMVPVIYYPLRSMPSVILGFKPWFLISCLLTQYSVSKNHSR